MKMKETITEDKALKLYREIERNSKLNLSKN